MTVVVTGFEPFDGLDHNPSAMILERLPRAIAGQPLHTAVLPVDTVRLQGALDALPRNMVALLHLGLAQDRPVISIERVGLNLLDFSRPDNAGQRRTDAPVVPRDDAPLALPARWPVRRVLEAWARADIPSMASTSAGTYLCNQALYSSLFSRPQAVQVGFVHVAPLRHQPIELAVRAVTIALEEALA